MVIKLSIINRLNSKRMQVANRTTRRYITPSTKNPTTNIRPTAKKHSNVPPV
jgi:hypothetical protein